MPFLLLLAIALTCIFFSSEHANLTFSSAFGGLPEVVNTFFERPLPLLPPVGARAALQPKKVPTELASQLTQVGSPGVPRPLWLVIAASIPTALFWYGAGYKMLAEEELYQYEVEQLGGARGFGGPGTMGPFIIGLALGPLTALLGLPGGASWGLVGFVWIYFTQYLLYERVNELFEARGLPPPLHVWWLIFPGFNLLSGLRQVHFLSEFWYKERGEQAPDDPVVKFFPFIGADRYTWREFLRRPALWCELLKDVPDVDNDFLKEP